MIALDLRSGTMPVVGGSLLAILPTIPPTAMEPAGSSIAPRLGQILGVDDSVSMRQMVVFTLRQGGYETVEAGHGGEALDRLAEASVDLVITDLNMPVMNGMTLIRAIRQMPAMKSRPVRC